jgi:hypothetical protein
MGWCEGRGDVNHEANLENARKFVEVINPQTLAQVDQLRGVVNETFGLCLNEDEMDELIQESRNNG